MYEQIDGILACLDLRCARCAALRSPCVPLHGVQNRPMYLNLALVYLNLGPPDRSLVPRDVQEASRADFGAISDLSGRLWKPKNTVKYKVFAVFHVAPQTSSRSSKSAPGRSQNHPQERPGAARDAPKPPKRLQDSPTSRQERPRSAPRATQRRLPSGLGGQVGPNWHKRAVRRPPGSHFGPPAGRFCTLRGSIFVQFSFLGKPSQSWPVGKACASIRPAPLYLLV